MSINRAELEVMRRMLTGEMSPDEIPALKTHRLRACAIAAYILLNREKYLDDDNRLRVPYGTVAMELVKGRFSGDVLVTVSKNLGLHTSASPLETGISMYGMRRIITIVPPPELSRLVTRRKGRPRTK